MKLLVWNAKKLLQRITKTKKKCKRITKKKTVSVINTAVNNCWEHFQSHCTSRWWRIYRISVWHFRSTFGIFVVVSDTYQDTCLWKDRQIKWQCLSLKSTFEIINSICLLQSVKRETKFRIFPLRKKTHNDEWVGQQSRIFKNIIKMISDTIKQKWQYDGAKSNKFTSSKYVKMNGRLYMEVARSQFHSFNCWWKLNGAFAHFKYGLIITNFS